MKTSITTIVWGKMHTLAELRKVLAEVRRVGYDGVGLETRLLPHEAIQNPRLVRKTLGESGVENAGSYSTMKLQDVAWASEAGTPLLWVVARGDREYDEAVGAVAQLSSLAAKSGITLALHNHLGTRFETEAQMRRVLREVRGLQVCFDTAHAEAAGIDSLKFIRDYRERIALVHVKDLRARVPKKRVSFTRDFVNVGEGIVDFRSVFGALRDVGYEGNLMLEVEALRGKEPDQLAREGYDRIQHILRET